MKTISFVINRGENFPNEWFNLMTWTTRVRITVEDLSGKEDPMPKNTKKTKKTKTKKTK